MTDRQTRHSQQSSDRNRTRFAAIALRIILGYFVVWPLLHILITRTTGISPWRFAGWGMYAVPQPTRTDTIYVFVKPSAQTNNTASSSDTELGWQPHQPYETPHFVIFQLGPNPSEGQPPKPATKTPRFVRHAIRNALTFFSHDPLAMLGLLPDALTDTDTLESKRLIVRTRVRYDLNEQRLYQEGTATTMETNRFQKPVEFRSDNTDSRWLKTLFSNTNDDQ